MSRQGARLILQLVALPFAGLLGGPVQLTNPRLAALERNADKRAANLIAYTCAGHTGL